MAEKIPNPKRNLRSIIQTLFASAGFFAIIALAWDIYASGKQDQSVATQIAQQSTQIGQQANQLAIQQTDIAFQATQIALGFEQKRITDQQATVIAKLLKLPPTPEITSSQNDPTATFVVYQSTQLASTLQFLASQQESAKQTQTAIAIVASAKIIDIQGKWQWTISNNYYGYFILEQTGNTFNGTLDDVGEGTYGDLVTDGIISGNSISFTRRGKYGIQYWEGVISNNNGILELQGRWSKGGVGWSPFTAKKKD